ncbi:hypothetical protein AVEN_155582-1 [Araneus ventricosus]|uniref:Uncharacterized protein n=1 Tax=Araneus ventricosus TaxID=182803 RepID=A0A4Y2W6G0_ARAVE|nr:hypothetical protein AVEN_155582-1 [Araneus ventricosus]
MKSLEEFQWLAYSEEKCGSCCKYCVKFPHSKSVAKGYYEAGCCQLHITYLRSFKNPRSFSSHVKCYKLSKQRLNTNDNFKTLCAQVKEIAAKLDFKEEIPRVCRLQTARNNVPYSKKNTIDELFMYLTLMTFVIH